MPVSFRDNIKPINDRKEKPNIICNKYITDTPVIVENQRKDKTISVNEHSCIYIYDSDYVSVTPKEFKQAMSGVMLYYELAEPIEEEVPEIDNYIQVKGGGTLTFEADDTIHMPVPSTDRFVVDLT